MSFRRKLKVGCLSFLGIALIAFFVGLPYLMVRLLTNAGTRPQDRALTSSPSDFDVAFEDIRFQSADGVSLSGWYLAGSADFSVAVGHGLFRSRREVLDRAVFFQSLGASVLIFDFRRHGDSDGEAVTLGYQERFDFLGAKDFLRQRNPGAPVVYYGVSMGAAAALLAGREEVRREPPTGGEGAVSALIVDSPFLSIEHTVTHHLNAFLGVPRFPFVSTTLWFLESRAGFEREDFDLEAAVSEMKERPILVIAGGNDDRMPPELQERVANASESHLSQFRSIEKAGHGAAYRTEPDLYEELVKQFLSQALPEVNLSFAPSAHAEGDSTLPSR